MIKIALSLLGGILVFTALNSNEKTQVPLDLIEPTTENSKRKRKRIKK